MDQIFYYTGGRKATKKEKERDEWSTLIIFGCGTLIVLIIIIVSCLKYYLGI